MSFSANAKAELCRVPVNRSCCAVAEVYGVLLFAYHFSAREIRVITGCVPFARRLPRLMQRAFGFAPEERAGGAKTTFTVTDPAQIHSVFNAFGYDADTALVNHITSACWRRTAARPLFSGARFWREAASPIPASAAIWSW